MQMLLPFVMLIPSWHSVDESLRNVSVPARVNLGAPMPMLPHESEVVFHVQTVKHATMRVELNFHLKIDIPRKGFLANLVTNLRTQTSKENKSMPMSKVKLQMPYAQD